jgi:hypothetical protein
MLQPGGHVFTFTYSYMYARLSADLMVHTVEKSDGVKSVNRRLSAVGHMLQVFQCLLQRPCFLLSSGEAGPKLQSILSHCDSLLIPDGTCKHASITSMC